MADHDGPGLTRQQQLAKARAGGNATGDRPEDKFVAGTSASDMKPPVRRLSGALLGRKPAEPTPPLRNEKERVYEPR